MGGNLLKGMQGLLAIGFIAVMLGSLAARPALAESASGAAAEEGTVVGDIDLNAPVPNYWPLPDGCKKMVPGGGAACDGCCRTTVNTWLSPWCWQHTKPGPDRDQCNQDATNWFIWCIQDCAGTAANQSSQASQ